MAHQLQGPCTFALAWPMAALQERLVSDRRLRQAFACMSSCKSTSMPRRMPAHLPACISKHMSAHSRPKLSLPTDFTAPAEGSDQFHASVSLSHRANAWQFFFGRVCEREKHRSCTPFLYTCLHTCLSVLCVYKVDHKQLTHS